jgi:antitoxin component YwqK of YwqJK toxin-antitoxin module
MGSWNSDVKTGEWTYWTERGRKEKMETYNMKGELHGMTETYNAAGKLESRGSFKDGKPDGKWEYYHEHGPLLRACTYKEGKLNGKSMIYSGTGKLIEEANYKNNKREGIYTSYDEKTGKVVLKQEYKDGKIVKVLEGKPR